MSKLFSGFRCISCQYYFPADGNATPKVVLMSNSLPSQIRIYYCAVTMLETLHSATDAARIKFGYTETGTSAPLSNDTAFQNLNRIVTYILNVPLMDNSLMTTPLIIPNSFQIEMYTIIEPLTAGRLQLDLFYIYP